MIGPGSDKNGDDGEMMMITVIFDDPSSRDPVRIDNGDSDDGNDDLPRRSRQRTSL